MPKTKTMYVCQNCGWSAPKWVGQCQSCQQWNTLVEETLEPATRGSSGQTLRKSSDFVVAFPEVEALSASKRRFSTHIGELDRVLGGPAGGQGMVPGAVMLIGGEPGIGKSTLLTQMVVEMLVHGAGEGEGARAAASQTTNQAGQPILYVAGEESPSQIAVRINRILQIEDSDDTATSGPAAPKTPSKTTKKPPPNPVAHPEQLKFVTSTDVDEVVHTIKELKPRLVIVDSIQTMTTAELSGAAGSVGQVREATERLTTTAKALHVPLFLVGHVTKEGTFAGPKVLEHIVDSVLELSGERTGDLRILRAIKNRFGATDETGIFRVEEFGLISVANPSNLFLEHHDQAVPGSATVCVVEGTRPLLVEVQALATSTFLAMPRRVGRGVELSRIQVLAAVLQKHARLPLDSHDVFVNVAGGFKVNEPAVDLGLAIAIASSLKNKAVPPKTVFIGEVGLLGEVRSVNYLDRRIKEAKRLGFEKVVSAQTHKTIGQVLGAFGL